MSTTPRPTPEQESAPEAGSALVVPAGGATSVAVLGTGTMGAGMARNLAAAGLDVRVWNRNPQRAAPLADVATVASTAAEACAGADVVLTMLFDLDATLEVMAGVGTSCAPGTVWLQCATVGVPGCDRLAAQADELGLVLVDAPVLGTRKPAEDGTLLVLASGPDEARPRLEPVLDAVSSRVMWLGPAGHGQRLKLAANAWVLTVVEGVAESMALTRELGLDPALFLEAVAGGAMDAPYVQMKGRAMLSGEHPASFALSGGVKDAALVLEAAEVAGVELGLMPGIHAHMERAAQAGHGDEDLSASYFTH
ncbi:NAD(P)-dependent oxidoreductase [Nocardioides sp. GY 10127]|uniref:NAD(P)-dependent oxidoreductase n=1 Tax=Nocardioides sp. GY 10127 TaxID=2569762 RepID=UPI0010A79492|nr:NAD(P)-dependent oxidoreductase [Nocardioides sp. GY 10127]TIC86423.1 NAD(P)-dependent oxidoreductase [Nocardioides sp. GY 10127]